MRNCLGIKQYRSKEVTTSTHFEKNFKKHEMHKFNKISKIFRRTWIIKAIHTALGSCYMSTCVKWKRWACKWPNIRSLLTLGFWSTAFFMFFSRWLFGPPSFSLTYTILSRSGKFRFRSIPWALLRPTNQSLSSPGWMRKGNRKRRKISRFRWLHIKIHENSNHGFTSHVFKKYEGIMWEWKLLKH